jgi:hypothetical protein
MSSSVVSFLFLATEDKMEHDLRLLFVGSVLIGPKGEREVARIASSEGVIQELTSSFLLTSLILGVVAVDAEVRRTLASILLTEEGVGSEGEK